jgi:hypothetical protein
VIFVQQLIYNALLYAINLLLLVRKFSNYYGFVWNKMAHHPVLFNWLKAIYISCKKINDYVVLLYHQKPKRGSQTLYWLLKKIVYVEKQSCKTSSPLDP